MNQLSKDLIIGAYTNYNWDQIKYWANSIERSGFTGDKAVIVYNSDRNTVQQLLSRDFKVMAFYQDSVSGNCFWPHDLVIVVERFFHLWQFLDQIPDNTYRWIISTDVKDVVFQRNPSEWLQNHVDNSDLVASCESLRYQNEPWGADNLQGSYPMIWPRIKNQPIWNCGVQAGRQQAIRELWLNIWLLCKAAGRSNPDQAAYNLLLNTKAWDSITKKTMSEDGWAAQVGTTVDPTKITEFRPNLLEPEPIWDGQQCLTSMKQPHVVLHQWDRIATWKTAIEQRYG